MGTSLSGEREVQRKWANASQSNPRAQVARYNIALGQEELYRRDRMCSQAQCREERRSLKATAARDIIRKQVSRVGRLWRDASTEVLALQTATEIVW
jgi:hypothetical protein